MVNPFLTAEWSASILWLTELFEYADTRDSKKLALPWREIISIKSKGLVSLYTFSFPRATSNRSAGTVDEK